MLKRIKGMDTKEKVLLASFIPVTITAFILFFTTQLPLELDVAIPLIVLEAPVLWLLGSKPKDKSQQRSNHE